MMGITQAAPWFLSEEQVGRLSKEDLEKWKAQVRSDMDEMREKMKLLTPKQPEYDLNGDGIPDMITRYRASKLDPVAAQRPGFKDEFVPGTCLRTLQGKVGDLRPSTEEVVRYFGLQGWPFSFSEGDPSFRFYEKMGFLSFGVGQRVGIVNDEGAIEKVMTIHGFTVGMRLGDIDLEAKIAYAPIVDKRGRVVRRAYELGNDGRVTQGSDVNRLVWVVGEADERLDPRLLVVDPQISAAQAEPMLSPPETVLKPLFEEAQRLAQQFPAPTPPVEDTMFSHVEAKVVKFVNESQKMKYEKEMKTYKPEMRIKLNDLLGRWFREASRTDTTGTVHVLTGDPLLWEGIKLAVGKVLSLSPSDFVE